MSSEAPPPKNAAPLPDHALPDVAPPTAGFILQLFLIPLIIVSIIVMVWLMFSWLATTTDPRSLVADIKRGDDRAWQNLGALAHILNDPQYKDIKKDQELAQALSNHLLELIRKGDTNSNAINIRIFLCKALGEFEVPTGLPALMVAAEFENDPAGQVSGVLGEIDVRRTAVEAIALLADNVGPETMQSNAALMKTLEKIAFDKPAGEDVDHRRAELRSATAFALGVIGGKRALMLLEGMLSDPYANTRYNAATGLARHGDTRAIPVLIEMLSVENEAALADEKYVSGREVRQAMLWANGARAAKKLAQENPTADLEPLREALEKLQASNPPRNVAQTIKETLEKMPVGSL